MKIPKGFTLIEVLIAIIFVGLGIAAIVGGNTAFTQANGIANELSTAEFLTEQLKEQIITTAYSNLISLNNSTYYPADFPRYSQKIKAQYVKKDDFTQVSGTNQHFIRITVTILSGTKEISSMSWIRAEYNAS